MVCSIDVIHSLHCVNQLRKAVYADHYFANRGQFYHLHMSKSVEAPILAYKNEELRRRLDHCVEHLRQSIQCSADLTPLTYAYDEQSGIGTPIWTNKHTCRDFSRILSWDQPKAKLPLAHPQLDV